MTTLTRRALAALAATLLLLGGLAVSASSAAQPTTPVLTGIRTGLNTGFDRVVLDLSGPRPAVAHRLVDELIADGSGEIVWLTGEHFVAVTATPAAAHGASGAPTYPGPVKFRTRSLRNVMAVAVTGDFEGVLSVGLGTRYRSWVRVFTLGSPTRVVIDIGH
ncbi:hypothetical protein DI005_33140 [Prauserella sp. PE36]|uniref:AMIN-like domain-containing protein n=1 Tax=Prauserella endophytica TaxID=1592324 RepID=A0ABY2S5S3_9PSEU|nr:MULTISPECIES: hypothetical protein [Prauserella]PXY29962.1 hypothetical protein BAY59_12005 [Prauserella coralliicola]RBM12359.1 hypothetical protein DI005_33140 [Prauserella sp. PE36]TKG71016.1 hypothetical protein FCN18_12865 [Prauserella endophytica]